MSVLQIAAERPHVHTYQVLYRAATSVPDPSWVNSITVYTIDAACGGNRYTGNVRSQCPEGPSPHVGVCEPCNFAPTTATTFSFIETTTSATDKHHDNPDDVHRKVSGILSVAQWAAPKHCQP